MKSKLMLLFLTLYSVTVLSQVDNQKRFQSDVRKVYTWNSEYEKYELITTEYEHSVIDIREIGSKTNGYIAISLHDNGLTRLYHGSIYNFAQTSSDEGTWLFKSKLSKGKITYNPRENTLTYLFDADKERYRKLIIFNVTPDELLSNAVRTIVKIE